MPKPIFSAETAAGDALEFTLKRLRPNMSLELRSKEGGLLLCGRLVRYSLNSHSLEAEIVADAEHFPDCPGEMPGSNTVPLAKIHYAEVAASDAEFYVYDTGWRQVEWQRPIQRKGGPFRSTSTIPENWQRYHHPPKAIPGVFWPEIRLAGGLYSITRTKDFGVPVAFALDYRVHKALTALSLTFEGAYFRRLKNGETELISPSNFFSIQGGIAYALLNRSLCSLALQILGGVISYSTDSAQSGLRPAAGWGLIFSWHFLRNNRDFHKMSLVLGPSATLIFNRESAWQQSPWLLDFKLGIQYAY